MEDVVRSRLIGFQYGRLFGVKQKQKAATLALEEAASDIVSIEASLRELGEDI